MNTSAYNIYHYCYENGVTIGRTFTMASVEDRCKYYKWRVYKKYGIKL